MICSTIALNAGRPAAAVLGRQRRGHRAAGADGDGATDSGDHAAHGRAGRPNPVASALRLSSTHCRPTARRRNSRSAPCCPTSGTRAATRRCG